MKKSIFLLILLSASFFSCSMNSEAKFRNQEEDTSVTLVSWNTQTFFDSEIQGTEYSDFQNLAKWSKDKYIARLGRLCEVMKALNADIYVFEEIENEAVIQDIANQLAGNSWERGNQWVYACFAKDSSSAIGCGVFSRYELRNMQIHSMEIRGQGDSQPSVRPLVQVTVDVEGKDLILFVNHWKSKSGGEAASEIWRDWQESVVASAVNKIFDGGKGYGCVLCGDFNRDAKEFVQSLNGEVSNVVLRGIGTLVPAYSPWINSSGDYSTETGSYFFNGKWERIDHFFSVGNVKLSAFCPKTDGPWCSIGGVPNSYKLYSGEGYSDHLPIMCIINLS